MRRRSHPALDAILALAGWAVVIVAVLVAVMIMQSWGL